MKVKREIKKEFRYKVHEQNNEIYFQCNCSIFNFCQNLTSDIVLTAHHVVKSVDVGDFQRRVGHFHRPFWVERDVAHQSLLGGRKLEGLPFHMV